MLAFVDMFTKLLEMSILLHTCCIHVLLFTYDELEANVQIISKKKAIKSVPALDKFAVNFNWVLFFVFR